MPKANAAISVHESGLFFLSMHVLPVHISRRHKNQKGSGLLFSCSENTFSMYLNNNLASINFVATPTLSTHILQMVLCYLVHCTKSHLLMYCRYNSITAYI
jgi:hypothetical protein